MSKLNGKVALVTGGSRGIGAAIAKRLATDGAKIVITYSASSDRAEAVVREIESAGGKALAVRADSADANAVKNAVKETVKAFGQIDILVNNAGIFAMATIPEVKEEDFDRMVAINVKAIFIATQAALQHMKDGGRIINIGSIISDYVPFPGSSIYALTKAAVAGFTRGAARELGPRGITVNNIQPGPINTELNPEDGDFAASLKAMIALGHYGKTEDIAALASHLAGPEGAYITGAQIKIDGGVHA